MDPQDANANKLKNTQAQVDEVVGIMRTNVEKVLERDQKLTDLDDRASALQTGAAQFEQSSRKLKRRYWYQNMKMNIIIGTVVIVILGLIIWSVV